MTDDATDAALIERYLWNLGGIDSLANGWVKHDEPIDESMVLPALESVRKLIRGYEARLSALRDERDEWHRNWQQTGTNLAMRIAEYRAALLACDSVMATQERRDAGTYHLSWAAFAPTWDAARAAARAALSEPPR